MASSIFGKQKSPGLIGFFAKTILGLDITRQRNSLGFPQRGFTGVTTGKALAPLRARPKRLTTIFVLPA
jgi:hypothetical protein